MHPLRPFLRLCSLCIAMAALPGASITHAAGFPERPIRLIVGFPAGGGADFVARQVATSLGQALGASVVVDNKPGANGSIAASDVARAPADGYTLLLGVTASQSISPALSQKLPYDVARDFTPITEVGFTPLVLVVSPTMPVKTPADFIRFVANAPDKVTYGSAGIGNITHMAGELFSQSTGAVKLTHVPYKGSAQVITDLLGGHVAAYFDTLPSSLPFIKSGQLRAVGLTSRERSIAAPDIPTMEESGVANYEATAWYGVFGPAKLPEELTARLNAALSKGLGTPEARQSMVSRGVEPVLDSPEHFRAKLEADLMRWREVTRKAKITLD